MKKAIVTGATGFVGSYLVKELVENGYEVFAVSRPHSRNSERLADIPHVQIIECDLENITQLPSLISVECDYFFHLAWEGSAGQARTDTHLQLKNVQWSVDALRAAKALDCSRFILAGSIMEQEVIVAHGTNGEPLGPGNIYSGSKLLASIMTKAVSGEIGMEFVSAEITNAYGVGEKSLRLVNSVLQKCLRNEAPQFTSGTQNYDFVYITDVARAFRLIAENGTNFNNYLIGSSSAQPLKKFLLEMQQEVAPNLEFVFGGVAFSSIALPLSAFDCTKTEQDTGFHAQITFAEGCRRTSVWLKSQMEEN